MRSAAQLDLKPAPSTADGPDKPERQPQAGAVKLPALVPPKPEAGSSEWWGQDASVVIREQPAISVYFNVDDDLVIRQKADGDPIIIVRPENIMRVIDALCDLAGIGSVGGCD